MRLKMSEEYEYDEETPEQEETDLRGEYVWDGSYLFGADMDVNDTGHEGYFLQIIANNLAELLIDLIKKIAAKVTTIPEEQQNDGQYEIDSNANDYIKELKDEQVNIEELEKILSICEEADPVLYSEFKKENNELFEGLEDPRKWGCKQGNIISREHNFELWGWNDGQAKNLLNMVYEIAQEDVVSPTTSLGIHDYQTGRNYSTTVGELEAKEKAQSIIPGAVKTQSNVHIPWDKSKLVGDSNNFVKFSDWIKLRESKT